MYKGEVIMHYDDKGYYKMLWQQLKEYKGEDNLYDQRTIEVYKKL